MKSRPLFAMRRRLVLPGCDVSLHLGRETSFRALDHAFSAGREVFVATIDGDALAPIGVVARIVSFGRLPAPRGIAGTEDRAVLRGLWRARLAPDARAKAREVNVEPWREDPGAPADAEDAARFEQLVASFHELEPFHAAESTTRGSEAIERLYRIAISAGLHATIRQRLLEADGLATKLRIARDALADRSDLASLEAAICARHP